MKEKKKTKSHEKFMTEKELNYVEALNKKILKRIPAYKLIELCFNNKNNEPFLRLRKDRKIKMLVKQKKVFFSLNLKKSKKKPRSVASEFEFTSSQAINSALLVEEIINLILKIKYNFNEIVLQEEEEYNPLNVSVNMKEENFDLILHKLEENLEMLFKHKKFLKHFQNFFELLDEEKRKKIIFIFLKQNFEEKNANIFVENGYKSIPVFEEKELSDFFNNFYKNSHFLILSIIFILKNNSLAFCFKKELNKKIVDKIFELKNEKFIWQFFAILATNVNKISKGEIFLLVKNKLDECVERRDENVKVFLSSIGKSFENYK
ncbi:hypothetical protein TUBRATIS_27440 [Tubulinosema ratisbonensis]|uniref:Uncharacterized protein n=1 Tax=Tubulinosema ratisbonensis TaxID=291195 RepID=A0A437AI21_9MICR|nr:hypothetical protein TUBRATIS_27440 [Tubulinosema ratisbonensis]